MTEEKTKELESENARLRAELERVKRRRGFLTTHDLPPAEEEKPRPSSPFVSTNEPRSGPKPVDLQTYNLKQEASDKKAAEILERVRGARKGGK